MKRHFLWMAVMVLFAAGCSSPYSVDIDEPIREDNKKAKEIIITASFDNQSDAQTKTVLNADGKVEWTPGDEIVIFSDGESAKFTSINTENARKANFRGTISFVTGATEGSDPDAFVYGLYPYDASATMSGGVITTTIPSSQVGLAGSFADDLALAVAKSVSTNLSFKNAYSGIDFEFSEEGFQTVTLSSNNGELIAGKVTVSFGSDGIPVTTVDANGSSSITLTAPGGGTFETGKRYYIVCAPQTLDGGYTLTAEKSTGRAVFERASKKEFKRNVLTDVSGYLNERATFESLNITFADANVKAICVAPATGWDTNGDGELSYTEAAAVTTIPYGVFSDNTTITSFDEFQYFTSVSSLGYDSDYDEGMDYYGAFSYCSALKSIILPPSLHDISYGAFRGCSSLETITIPATVTRIGQVAFDGCTNLEVIMESETPCTLYPDSYGTYPGETCAFGLYDNEVKAILVPTDESVTAYKTAQYWSDYAFLIHKIGWIDPTELITFQDAIVELYCVDRWDTNGDERLSKAEAAAVTDIGTTFQGVDITSFDELKYFTGITTIPESAFEGCSLLESISFPPQITSVGTNAFKNSKLNKLTVPSIDVWFIVCPAQLFTWGRRGDLYINDNLVTEIVVPSGTTSVPAYMCAYINNIEAVSLPSSVTAIGKYAFVGCQWLSSIDLEGLLQIGEYAFSGCSSLASINLESVTSIGNYAFSGCSALTSISLREGGVGLGNYAFQNCTGLTSLVLPNGTGLGGKAGVFRGCSGLVSVVLPTPTGDYYSQNSIGVMQWSSSDGVFGDCTSLLDIVIPEGIKYIFGYSFSGCSSLKNISLPSTLKNIYDYAFYGCTGITSDIVIPGSVSTISKYAFANCNVEGNIILGEGVTTIERNAFTGTSATKISLPSTIQTLYTYVAGSVGVKAMDYGAFVDTQIETYEVYSSTLGETFRKGFTTTTYAWMNNLNGIQSEQVTTAAKNIIVKKSDLTYTLPDNAFYELKGIESVTLPNGLTSIGSHAFSGLYSSGLTHLTSITLPTTLKTIGAGAFLGCSGLTSITIPSGVTSIGNNAFKYCSGLNSISVASGNTTYDSRENCNAIIETASNILLQGCNNTVIPNSVASIQSGAFCNCSLLQQVSIPAGITSIESDTFSGCTNLSSVYIPQSVTTIGASAFSYCKALTGVIIPENVTSIGGNAFYGCSGLTSVIIPENVASIGGYAFYGCSGLTSIQVNPTTPPTGGSAMFNNTTAPIYVPAASVDDYKTASNWSTYASRIRAIP